MFLLSDGFLCLLLRQLFLTLSVFLRFAGGFRLGLRLLLLRQSSCLPPLRLSLRLFGFRSAAGVVIGASLGVLLA